MAKGSRRAISGVLLLDKPAGLSSTNALGRAKWLFQAEKGGHTGTLDPFATGLLPLCFGEATKFSRFMLDADKTYIATLKLGSRTATGDTESEPFEQRPIDFDDAKLDLVLASFRGQQQQIPPMHSALKQDGVALYKLARQGIEVVRAPRDITISLLRLTARDSEADTLTVETRVSKGTYIRVLAEQIGEALGCGAHLIALRRTATAGYAVADAITLEGLDAMAVDARDGVLRTADSLCAALPQMVLDSANTAAFAHGRAVSCAERADCASGEIRVYGVDKQFLGVAAMAPAGDGALLTPVRLMAGLPG
jgi:tRNA pseudouridine55 synthase